MSVVWVSVAPLKLPRKTNGQQWIHVYLTLTYSLDTLKKEKAGIFIEDLAILLNHHWICDEEVFAHERLCVQLVANLILAGATATRPEVNQGLPYSSAKSGKSISVSEIAFPRA